MAVDVVYLDFCKAFDHVFHNFLLENCLFMAWTDIGFIKLDG